MTAKTYDDGKGTTYTYNADGQILSRTWARSVAPTGRLVTTYGYDNGGSLLSTLYSDGSTPSITYTRNRLGAPATVADAAGTHTFSYNPDTSLASVTVPHILNHKLEYAYDNLGRRTSMQLMDNSLPVSATHYTYDAMSRIATVGDGTNTATYTRIPGMSLLNTTTIKQGTVDKLITSRVYDQQNRLTSISSVSPAPSVPVSFSYVYNDRDQRTKLTLADGSYWLYSYDEKGQVTSFRNLPFATRDKLINLTSFRLLSPFFRNAG
jgi:YD repeat-containing protein